MNSFSTKLIRQIENRIKRVEQKVPMSGYTSFRIGGPAELMVFPDSEAEVLWLQDFAQRNYIDYFILGRGTNLLVKDKGIKGLVINMRYLNHFKNKFSIILYF